MVPVAEVLPLPLPPVELAEVAGAELDAGALLDGTTLLLDGGALLDGTTLLDGGVLVLVGVLLLVGLLLLVELVRVEPPLPGLGIEPIGATEVGLLVLGLALDCRSVLLDTACPGSTDGFFVDGWSASISPPAVSAVIRAAAATAAPISGPRPPARRCGSGDVSDRSSTGGIGGRSVGMKAVSSSGLTAGPSGAIPAEGPPPPIEPAIGVATTG